jgi:hypothetical protein
MALVFFISSASYHAIKMCLFKTWNFVCITSRKWLLKCGTDVILPESLVTCWYFCWLAPVLLMNSERQLYTVIWDVPFLSARNKSETSKEISFQYDIEKFITSSLNVPFFLKPDMCNGHFQRSFRAFVRVSPILFSECLSDRKTFCKKVVGI